MSQDDTGSHSLILDLRNRRLCVWALSNPDGATQLLEQADDFWIVRDADATIRARFNSVITRDHEEELRFTNFVQRSNDLPEPLDLGPVYTVLVSALCQRALRQLQRISGPVNLYYLIHLNSHQSLWSALPARPFRVHETQVVPTGFLDEMVLMLTGANLRISEERHGQSMDLYLIFRIYHAPIVCRTIHQFAGRTVTITLESIFPIDRPPDSLCKSHNPTRFMFFDGLSGNERIVAGFIAHLRDLSAPENFQGKIRPIAWGEMLNTLLPFGHESCDRVYQLHLPDCFGFSNGSEKSFLISSESQNFPSHMSSALIAEGDQKQCRLRFFRGYFPHWQYSYCFDSVDLGAQTEPRSWILNTVLENREEANVECLALESTEEIESLKRLRLVKPERLLRKRTRR